ncbi:putative DNA repair protein RAD2 [Trypanosoma conorhini]|uniref:Putative DNA repair protein RAD2 n=1 Tax=Trypanosoma conorhini TaxID=83891 RepID=A0A422P053_9TRYP|nr:putative DNA repair protein RAD2 [Trypanosoma conorhini]RNF11088.1 putative DNA repair protein RAD2 [Trypanosoma conorhini]
MEARPSASGRRPSTASSQLRSMALANSTAMGTSSGGPLRQRLRGSRINKNILCSKVMYADDSDLMVSLMQQACPRFPENAKRPSGSESCEQTETDSQLYIKALSRGLDEALVRKRKTNAKSQSASKESVASWVQSGNAPSATPAATATATATAAAAAAGGEKGALEVWMEGQRAKQRVTRSAEPFSKNRSLVIAINNGRFPRDANAPISEAARKWEKAQQPLHRRRNHRERPRQKVEEEEDDDGVGEERKRQEASLSSPKGCNGFPTLLERLKREPVQSWRLIHNLTEEPASPVKGRRELTGCRTVDSMFVERLRHKFDYVSYKEQFDLDKSLAARDVCRFMVMRHETSTNGQPPLRALANMFQRNRARFSATKRELPPGPGEAFLWRSVWMRRANEIALEEERRRIIDGIQAFELRVPAASLSKEAVDGMQKDIVKLLKQWPCSYRKRHIFTKFNFVEWVRERNKLSPTAGTQQQQCHGLAESMASRAEALFIEHVLTLLPEDKGVHVTRRPATAQ